jgi:signal transduction histidine kinase
MHNNVLYFYLGIAFVQCFFIIYQFSITKRTEFTYYLLYVLLLTFLISFHWMPNWGDKLNLVNTQGYFFWARATLFFALGAYFGFGRHFCEMDALHTSHAAFQKKLERTLMALALFEFISCYIYKDYWFPDIIYKFFIVGVMLYSIYIIWFLATRKKILNVILVTGSACLLLGGIIYAIEYVRTDNDRIGAYYMQFYVFGAILEFLFLNYGLMYKSKQVQMEYDQQLAQKQFQFDTQRTQLLATLQDEIASGISSIKINAEMLLSTQLEVSAAKQGLNKVIASADTISGEMNAIVWSLNSEYDTLYHTLEYIQQYAFMLLDHHGISFKYINDAQSEADIKINGLSRHNTISICKQIFTHIVQYSGTKRVFVYAIVANHNLLIKISSDATTTESNTILMANIKGLAADINATVTLEQSTAQVISYLCPLEI